MSVPAFAVFGHPIAHSLSPRIHQAFAAQFSLTLSYHSIDAAPEVFADAVAGFFGAQGGRGANVTLPHKAAAYALATRHSATARQAGTCNVLTPAADGTLDGHNTDGIGLVRDLCQRHGVSLAGARVLLLGAGGAARGVAGPLLDAQLAELHVVNRRADGARALAAAFDDPRLVAHGWDALADLRGFDLVLHATAAGVLGQSLALPTGLLGATGVAYDLSYGPAARAFVAWGRAAGARLAIDGLGMLVETAADAFALWHGRMPATEPVYRALRSPPA